MSKQDEQVKRLIEIQAELDLRKALYAEYDKIVVELAHGGFIRANLDGLVVELKDNFADSNTGWTRSAVKRFEVEIISAELAEKRAAKRKAAL
jgi:hypothetical protein